MKTQVQFLLARFTWARHMALLSLCPGRVAYGSRYSDSKETRGVSLLFLWIDPCGFACKVWPYAILLAL